MDKGQGKALEQAFVAERSEETVPVKIEALRNRHILWVISLHGSSLFSIWPIHNIIDTAGCAYIIICIVQRCYSHLGCYMA